MSQKQRDCLDGLIDRAARGVVAGDLPRQVVTRALAIIDDGIEPRIERSGNLVWRWGIGIAAAATVVLAASPLWKGAPPPNGTNARPRQEAVASVDTIETVEPHASPNVETPARTGSRARRVEARIPGPVTIEPVSVAVVEVGGVAIASVEITRVEVARVEVGRVSLGRSAHQPVDIVQ
jgi:hypothetical protein